MQVMTQQVVLWLFGVVVSVVQTWFWFYVKSTQKRIEKLEQENDHRYAELNRKLDDIKTKLDTNAGIERPASACREHLEHRLADALQQVGQMIELAIFRARKDN